MIIIEEGACSEYVSSWQQNAFRYFHDWQRRGLPAVLAELFRPRPSVQHPGAFYPHHAGLWVKFLNFSFLPFRNRSLPPCGELFVAEV